MPSLCERVQKHGVTKTKTQPEISKEQQGLSLEKTFTPWEYIAQTRLKLSIIDRRQSSENNKVF